MDHPTNMSAIPHFTRHRGPITCAVGVPGKPLVITSGYDGAVACFPLDGGPVELLGYHDHLVNRVTVDPTGRWAASVSSDFDIYLWDLETKQRARVLHGHADDVEDFCFLGGGLGASVSRDWRVLVWELSTGSIVKVLHGHEKDVLSVVAHAGKLYTSGDDMTLRSWDIATGRQLRVWGPFETEADTCAIDTIRGRAILGCDDGLIRVFDVDSGHELEAFEAHASGIKKVACSPVSGDILSAAYDQRICIWGEGNKLLRTLAPSRTKWERSFNWSPDGQQVYAGTFDGTVQVWSVANGTRLPDLGTGEDREGNDCFNDVAAMSGGDIAVVNDEGRIRTASLTSQVKSWKHTLEPASGRMLMNAVIVDEDHQLLAAGSHDQRLHLFPWTSDGQADADGPARAPAAPIEQRLDEGPINCIRICNHPDHTGEVFVACYSGAVVRVARDGTILARFRPHDNAIKALRLHPTLALGVSGSADGGLASWSLDGTAAKQFLGHTAIIDDLDLSPSGTLVASTGRDFTVRVYELETGTMRHCVALPRRSPKALCFISEDALVLSTYWGELVRVRLHDGKILTRQIARNGISALSHQPDGERLLVAASYDGGVYLVDPDTLEVRNVLRGMTQRVDGQPWHSQLGAP